MQDLIIENGHVVDWFSNTDTMADISVKDGVITAIGKATESAKRRIDAAGLLVIPGIIDSHMHASSWLAGRKSYKMLALAAKDAIIMHPGPVNRGIELTPSLIDGESSRINEQVTNGLSTRMALLSLLKEYREKNL